MSAVGNIRGIGCSAMWACAIVSLFRFIGFDFDFLMNHQDHQKKEDTDDHQDKAEDGKCGKAFVDGNSYYHQYQTDQRTHGGQNQKESLMFCHIPYPFIMVSR